MVEDFLTQPVPVMMKTPVVGKAESIGSAAGAGKAGTGAAQRRRILAAGGTLPSLVGGKRGGK